MDRPDPEISFDDVHMAYPDAVRPALTGVDLQVAHGEFVLVSGGSGSGKSTALRCVNGLVPHTSGGRFHGRVTVAGRSTEDHPPRQLADVVGFVHQDPEAQTVVDEVEADIAFVLENLSVDAATMRRRVEEVLDALDVAALRHRHPATLSGGERQRCAIAAALAASPAVLVLDEPTSQLDPQGAEDVLGAIARLNSDLGTTVVLAEHRLDRAAPLVDRVVLLADGRVADEGDARRVLATYPGAPAVTRLGVVTGWDPLPLTVKEARAAQRHHPVALPVDAPSANASDSTPAPGDVLVAARGLRVVRGDRTVLDGVTLTVHAGDVVAVLGRNGAGKSSLLRVLTGMDTVARGTVDAHCRTAYVPQNPNLLFSAPTVRDEVTETLRLLGRNDPDAVDRWLEVLGLGDLATRHPRSLSGGERQRAAVAAVAVGGAPVLALDEPTRGMDAQSRRSLAGAIRAHADNGGAVVLATHDVELAADIATHAVVLGDGGVVADGPARSVLAGSLFAPQVLRVVPPYLTVDEVVAARDRGAPT